MQQDYDSFHQQISVKLKGETSEVLHLEHSFVYGSETLTLQKLDEKYLECFEMWQWRRIEKISWTDRVRNVEALHGVKEERNIIQ
jgi:hypothetical protein